MEPPPRVKTDLSLLVRSSTDITSSWLSSLLSSPTTLISVSPVGTGQVASTYRARFNLSNGSAGSLVVKLSSESEGSREFGLGGAYEKECQVYARLSETLKDTGVVPKCWLAICDNEGWFTLVLEDVADGVQGDQVEGLSLEHARRAMVSLAQLHAPFVNDVELENAEWLVKKSKLDKEKLYNKFLPEFVERYQHRFHPQHLEVITWFASYISAYIEEPPSPLKGLKHQDYRADNLLFTPSRCIAVDFQGAGYGYLLHDAAFFLGGSLQPEMRKEHEEVLVRQYVDLLRELRKDVVFEWEECWYQYRRQSLTALWVVVIAGTMCVQTERGDSMFAQMASRACQMAIDLNVKEIFEVGEKVNGVH